MFLKKIRYLKLHKPLNLKLQLINKFLKNWNEVKIYKISYFQSIQNATFQQKFFFI